MVKLDIPDNHTVSSLRIKIDGRFYPVFIIPEIFSVYNGARYRFASADHKKMFDAEPKKYEPQFGGYCAYGASENKLVPVDIEAFQIVNGRLLMQYSKRVREKFNEDTQGRLKKADTNWPGLVEQYGK